MSNHRQTLRHFLQYQDHIAGYIADPKHYAVIQYTASRARTVINDLSIALKNHARQPWDDPRVTVSQDAAYRFDMEYVFTHKTLNSLYYVIAKRRGEASIKEVPLSTKVTEDTVFASQNIELFDAVCTCLAAGVINSFVTWFGIPTPYHIQRVKEKGLELDHIPGETTFKIF